MAQNDEALLAGLKALSGVDQFTRQCSVCGKTSDKVGASVSASAGKPALGIVSNTAHGNETPGAA